MHPERRELLVLGRRARATRLPPPLVEWLCGEWELGEVDVAASDCEIDLSWRARARWQRLPSIETCRSLIESGDILEWIRHGERWWSTSFGMNGLELELHGNHARVRLWGDRWRDEWRHDEMRMMRLALHLAMREAMRSRGLVPLHAAVVVRDGRATALLGPSGVAKSSALLDAARAGWLPLAEDLAWLEPESLLVHGSGGARARRASSVPLARVALLERDAARRSSSAPLARREALVALWKSAGVPLCRRSASDFAARVPSLLDAIEWTRLIVGRGPLVL